MLFVRLPGAEALCLLQVLAQGLLALSWGCGRESRQAGSYPKLLHTSLLGRRAQGNDVSEAADGHPRSQPPGMPGWRPQPVALGGAVLRAALSLGDQATAEGALHLPFPSLSQSSPCLSPWQYASHRPLSTTHGRLGSRFIGKADAELRSGRRQWRLPGSRSLLVPGQEA